MEQGNLAIRNVSKKFNVTNGTLDVLKEVNFSVVPGEFVSIVGASGCGKSTLLRLIVGLDSDYSGDILLDGNAISGTSLDRGIVFQEHRLLPWLTVEDNVGLGLESSGQSAAERKRIVHEHIRLVGLAGFEEAYPHQLSGGMAQRAAIARGLVNRPEILLLDEPLGALDALTRIYLQEELLRIWEQEKTTMILVTHDVEEAIFLSDKIVVMQARPGAIREVLPVELPRPRDRASHEFADVKRQILDLMAIHH